MPLTHCADECMADVMTRGGHAGGQARYAQSHSSATGSWGLLRNTFQEFSSLSFAGLDSHLAAPGSQPWPEHADAFGLALGGNYVATPRMLPVCPATTAPLGAAGPHTGALLITGGLGGLGILFAQQAAQQGAGRLVLQDLAAARPIPWPLASSARECCVVGGDVSSAADAAGVAAAAEPGLQMLHAAGLLEDKLLLKQTAASFRAVLSGKVGRPAPACCGVHAVQT